MSIIERLCIYKKLKDQNMLISISERKSEEVHSAQTTFLIEDFDLQKEKWSQAERLSALKKLLTSF